MKLYKKSELWRFFLPWSEKLSSFRPDSNPMHQDVLNLKRNNERIMIPEYLLIREKQKLPTVAHYYSYQCL